MLLASQAHAALTSATQDGFHVQWTQVFSPSGAVNIAACPAASLSDPGTLYHLRHKAGSALKSVWRSTNGGVSWTNLRSVPATITSIACGGETDTEKSMFAFDTDHVHRFYGTNLNSDEPVHGPQPNMRALQTGPQYGDFIGLDLAGGLQHFGRSFGAEYQGPYLTTAPWAGTVTWSWANREERGFGLSADRSTLAYVRADGATWTPISSVVAADNLIDISASAPTVLYALKGQAGANIAKLYRANFSEVDCTDGFDNDGDGVFDFVDADCQ